MSLLLRWVILARNPGQGVVASISWWGHFPCEFHSPDKHLIVRYREAGCGLPFISNKNNNDDNSYRLLSASLFTAFISPDSHGSLSKEALNQ